MSDVIRYYSHPTRGRQVGGTWHPTHASISKYQGRWLATVITDKTADSPATSFRTLALAEADLGAKGFTRDEATALTQTAAAEPEVVLSEARARVEEAAAAVFRARERVVGASHYGGITLDENAVIAKALHDVQEVLSAAIARLLAAEPPPAKGVRWRRARVDTVNNLILAFSEASYDSEIAALAAKMAWKRKGGAADLLLVDHALAFRDGDVSKRLCMEPLPTGQRCLVDATAWNDGAPCCTKHAVAEPESEHA